MPARFYRQKVSIRSDAVNSHPIVGARADLPWAGRPWRVRRAEYDSLLVDSEYAAWMAAFGFRVNHFTVLVNALTTFPDLESLNAFRTPGQRRLIFEEFFLFQVGILLRRREADAERKPFTIVADRRAHDAAKQVLKSFLYGQDEGREIGQAAGNERRDQRRAFSRINLHQPVEDRDLIGQYTIQLVICAERFQRRFLSGDDMPGLIQQGQLETTDGLLGEKVQLDFFT